MCFFGFNQKSYPVPPPSHHTHLHLLDEVRRLEFHDTDVSLDVLIYMWTKRESDPLIQAVGNKER